MDHEIFLSYSSSDRAAADRVCEALESAGASCWIAPRDIPAGSIYAREIVEAIRQARVVVLILSQQANRSQWVMREIERAVHNRCSILTFRIESVALSPEMELFLSTQQWLDGEAALAANDFSKLIDAVRRISQGNDSPDKPDLPKPATRRTNLPNTLTSFVGRVDQIARAESLLRANRLVTLTGPGGTGKTRLSMEVARRSLDSYLDGVWFVDLSAVTNGALLADEVASVLEIREQPQKTTAASVFQHLASSQTLLVLDNCEQVLTASARFCKDLLIACPGARILATSRGGLNIAGEAACPVPPLTVFDPKTGAGVSQRIIDDLMATEAARLFVERARSQRPEFAVTEENALAVAQVCRRLDGLPLAIELAAARTRILSPQQISDKLNDRFRLLRSVDKTVPERQQTLQAALDWSYDLLTEQECVLLARLSVFSGGWTLEAAEQICSADTLEDWEVLDVLASLADKCMVVAQETEHGMGYRLLETVREYAWQRLEQIGETAAVRARHCSYFAGLAHQARMHVRGQRQQQWMRAMDRDRDNLLNALAWRRAASEPDGLAALLRDLWPFWHLLGRFSEGISEIDRALEAVKTPPLTAAWASVLNGGGVLCWSQGRLPKARRFCEMALEIQDHLGDREGAAATLTNIGLIALDESDKAAASDAWHRSLKIQNEIGDVAGMAITLNNLGLIPFESGEYALARPLFQESLALRTKLDDKAIAVLCLTNLGLIACYEGDLEAATNLHQEALALAVADGDQCGRARALHNLAEVAFFRDDLSAAAAFQQESLTISDEIGDPCGQAESLIQRAEIALKQNDLHAAIDDDGRALAVGMNLNDVRLIVRALECAVSVNAHRGDWRSAALLLGAAQQRRDDAKIPLEPVRVPERDRLTHEARRTLGEKVFLSLHDTGRAMALDEAKATLRDV